MRRMKRRRRNRRRKRGGKGGRENKKKKEEKRREEGGGGGEEDEEINMCTLSRTHSDLQYLSVLPTFLSYSFFHCLDAPAAVTSATKCSYRVTGTVDC
jgi:hypothetical protein